MCIFNKIARHFETRYWYHSRKITTLYFDEDSQKFETSFPKERAKDIFSSYWNGEADLWRILLLKLENMFWSLHKNGVTLNYYFYETDIEKYASDEDKIFISKKVINQTVKKAKNAGFLTEAFQKISAKAAWFIFIWFIKMIQI